MRLGETPVPIPNTMVKTQEADGTMLETAWESRWLPDSLGGLAQLGERLPCKQEVAGSIPTISTNIELKMDGSGQEVVRFDLVSSETGNCTLKTEQ